LYSFISGDLKHIQKLRRWNIEDVLQEKYHFDKEEAKEISDFLLPVLQVNIDKRASAETMLNHSWLNGSIDESRKESK